LPLNFTNSSDSEPIQGPISKKIKLRRINRYSL